MLEALGSLRFSLVFLVGAVVAMVPPSGAYAKPERPLVFIPGILGSRLADSSGQLVWGDVSSLTQLDRLRRIEGAPPFEAKGLVTEFRLLGPFIKVRQYDSLIKILGALGYRESQAPPNQLLVFGYDWRQSNFETAARFDQFVKEKIPSGDFDILAHSMGGLVARIYIKEFGNGRVQNLVAMGTPYRGSLQTLRLLQTGWGPFANHVAGGMQTIRDVILTFPSLFELLPRYNCCSANGERVDVMEFETWLQLDLLPAAFTTGQKLGTIKKNLERAAQLSEIVGSQPRGVNEHRIAGFFLDTLTHVDVPSGGISLGKWTVGSGDGTVATFSAYDGRTDNASAALAAHTRLFTSKNVAAQLALTLQSKSVVSVPSFSEGDGLFFVQQGKKHGLLGLSVNVENPLIRHGELGVVAVQLRFRDVPRELQPGAVRVVLHDSEELVVKLVSQRGSVVDLRAEFRKSSRGPGTVQVHIPGVGMFEEDFIVVN
ncbi:MAG: alpha/beta fold hydrolase [Proteobacteria bacterium]|nr:alpha/beta fold hydrolase [Pseudomonadota bacterium]